MKKPQNTIQPPVEVRQLTVLLPATHEAQRAVKNHPARFKVVAAGRRWGKGVLGVGECVKRASRGAHCWWVAPTFASAAFQAGWRMLEFYARKLPGVLLQLQKRSLAFPGGGWVQFKTAEEPDSLRGESIDFAVVDEAAHVPKLKEIWELCLRSCLLDRRGEAWFISTPKGANYFEELFRRGKAGEEGWVSFQYPSRANPHLDLKELLDIAKDMPALVRRQEIEAEFVQLAGALFRRDAVRFLELEPPGMLWVRSWDLAFTKKSTSDYTAGARVGLAADGTVVVADVVRGRWEWPAAVRVVADTARMDGVAVRQGVEVVGAQVGFLDTLLVDPLLVGYAFEPIKVHADKLTRALPAVARCEQGKLALVRGAWNRAFLDELGSFTGDDDQHDDQVDALSGATVLLGTPTGALESGSQLSTAPRSDWLADAVSDRPRVQDFVL